MPSYNDAPLCHRFGRQRERWNTWLRRLPGPAVGLSHWPHFDYLRLQQESQPSMVFLRHGALVIQLWPGFSKATQVLRAVRPWVIIHLAFTLSSFWFILHLSPFGLFFGVPGPYVAVSVSLFLGVPGSLWQFLFSDIILHYRPCWPPQALPQFLFCLCFSWSQPAVITAAFSGILQVVERGFFPVIIALSSNFD